jgi:F subunit of K+-transporting ATPase (Potass_KdpF)
MHINFFMAVALFLAIVLLVHLVITLLFPEKF